MNTKKKSIIVGTSPLMLLLAKLLLSRNIEISLFEGSKSIGGAWKTGEFSNIKFDKFPHLLKGTSEDFLKFEKTITFNFSVFKPLYFFYINNLNFFFLPFRFGKFSGFFFNKILKIFLQKKTQNEKHYHYINEYKVIKFKKLNAIKKIFTYLIDFFYFPYQLKVLQKPFVDYFLENHQIIKSKIIENKIIRVELSSNLENKVICHLGNNASENCDDLFLSRHTYTDFVIDGKFYKKEDHFYKKDYYCKSLIFENESIKTNKKEKIFSGYIRFTGHEFIDRVSLAQHANSNEFIIINVQLKDNFSVCSQKIIKDLVKFKIISSDRKLIYNESSHYIQYDMDHIFALKLQSFEKLNFIDSEDFFTAFKKIYSEI